MPDMSFKRPDADEVPEGEQYVSTARAAAALGVSVTTVKRWVDDGVIPAHRTVGKHRKLLVSDLLRLAKAGRLPQADLGRLAPTATQGQCNTSLLSRLMFEACRDGDNGRVRDLIHGAYQDGMPLETLADQVISPVLRQIGHEWAAGRVEVMHEHRATQACVAALFGLKNAAPNDPRPGRPVAVGGAPEHDHYLLPTLLAQLTLFDAGWDAIDLGPHTPAAAFRTALDELRPRLVWVSASHVADPEVFLAEYNAFYREADARGVAVAVGGQGLVEGLRERMEYTSFGDGMTHLAAFARTLHPRPARPRRGRPPGSGTKRDGGGGATGRAGTAGG